MVDSKSVIVLLVGKSGTGKTTIAERCGQLHGLTQINSYTTRPKRTPDETGHIFVDDAAFHNLTDLVAYTKFNGYEYCATTQQVEKNDIYVIDPKGVEYFKEHYKGNKQPMVVYIVASEDPHKAFNICYERMKERGSSIDEAAERVVFDNREFKEYEKQADYVFANEELGDIDSISENIYRIIKNGGLNG